MRQVDRASTGVQQPLLSHGIAEVPRRTGVDPAVKHYRGHALLSNVSRWIIPWGSG
jgi:hypothetical protein